MVELGAPVMPKVGGKSFRCPCGCNVFTKVGFNKLECNACKDRYITEPKEEHNGTDPYGFQYDYGE